MADFGTFKGKTAVVTGGASGIGRGLAERFIAEGMNVVIADIEEGALRKTADAIGAHGVLTDVSDLGSVQALANATLDKFGDVHLVCNNAGIGPMARIKDLTIEDWHWMLGVNLWGVIHGVHTFLPILLDNPDGGWIVNTASMGGLAALPALGAYATAKFGVAGLTETLAIELKEDGAKVGATLLCPGPIHSNLGKSSRNRPSAYADGKLADVDLQGLARYKDAVPWKEPSFAADVVVKAIRNGDLYAVTHPEQVDRITTRVQGLLKAFGR